MDYNGAQNADNISDIGKLIEILNEWEFKYEEEKRESKQGTIPQNPKYADIIKTIGNVGLSVPMGFVMVHNDLSDIYKLLLDISSSKESTSSSSWQEVADTAINVAGDSAIALASIGLVSQIIDKYSLSEIIDGIEDIVDLALNVLPKATSTIAKSLEEIGLGVATTLLNIGDLATDADIIAQRKANSQRYLNVYYSSLFKDLGYEAVLSEDGTEITGVKPYSAKERVIDLKSILNGGLSKESISVAIEGVGEAVGTLATAVPKAWANLAEEELPQLLLTGLGAYDIATDPEVKNTISRMMNYYVQAYYGSQIAELGWVVDFENNTLTKSLEFEQVWGAVKEAIGIGASGGWTTVVDALVSSVSSGITQVSTAFKGASGGENTNALIEAYGLYLKAFYANQIAGLGYEADFENNTVRRSESVTFDYIFNLAKEVIGIGVSGGWTTAIDALSSSISDSITQISTAFKGASSGENAEALTEAYGLYLKAYYATQIAGLGYEVDYEKGTLTRKTSWDYIESEAKGIIGQVLTGGIGLGIEALAESGAKAYSSIADAIGDEDAKREIRNTVITDLKNIISDADVDLLEYSNNLSSFATEFSNILLEQIQDTKNNKDFQLSNGILGIGNEIGELKKIFINKLKDTSPEIFTDALSKSYSESVKTTVKEAVGNYNIEIKDATKTISSYNESNLFAKLDAVLNKLTIIVNALSDESSGSSKYRLTALNDTLTEGFSDLSSFLANTPNPTGFVDEGNGFVDNMIQMG